MHQLLSIIVITQGRNNTQFQKISVPCDGQRMAERFSLWWEKCVVEAGYIMVDQETESRAGAFLPDIFLQLGLPNCHQQLGAGIQNMSLREHFRFTTHP